MHSHLSHDMFYVSAKLRPHTHPLSHDMFLHQPKTEPMLSFCRWLASIYYSNMSKNARCVAPSHEVTFRYSIGIDIDPNICI